MNCEKIKNQPFFRFGDKYKGLEIEGVKAEYPVLNERAVRAGAGIMFAIGIITLMYTFLTKDFRFVVFVVGFFWFDFLIKIVIGPHVSPISNLAKLMVKNQKPEFVGAIQKRFAWALGFIMATIALVIIGLNMIGPILFILCSICLLFMWMETSLGLCIGCKLYPVAVKLGLLKKPKVAPACPGGVCSIKR